MEWSWPLANSVMTLFVLVDPWWKVGNTWRLRSKYSQSPSITSVPRLVPLPYTIWLDQLPLSPVFIRVFDVGCPGALWDNTTAYHTTPLLRRIFHCTIITFAYVTTLTTAQARSLQTLSDRTYISDIEGSSLPSSRSRNYPRHGSSRYIPFAEHWMLNEGLTVGRFPKMIMI